LAPAIAESCNTKPVLEIDTKPLSAKADPGTASVRARNLVKTYLRDRERVWVEALRGVDLSVSPGEVTALLGPNGAGKTSLLRICTTRARPTAGTVEVMGIDVVQRPAAAREQLGTVPQEIALDTQLTARENLRFHCRYFGMGRAAARDRAAELLAEFDLEDHANATPRELSGGLARRLQIARAVAHRPRVLFLDEPTVGLDIVSRREIWETIRTLRASSAAIVLATHNMDEAERLSDNVAVIRGGEIVARGAVGELISAATAAARIEVPVAGFATTALPSLHSIPGVRSVEHVGDRLVIVSDRVEDFIREGTPLFDPLALRDMRISSPSLEDVVLELIGREKASD
jgi:ABC-2 type transport system ATP-binding protein